VSKFKISIIDEFYNEKDFQLILNKVSNISWEPLENIYIGVKEQENKHFWFSSPLNFNDSFSKKTLDLINEKTFKKFTEFKTLNFSLAHKPDNFPHVDTYHNASFQFIIYINGPTDINQGTGFYIKENKEAILNTHVGFYLNRLVMWNCGVYHAPLLWNNKEAEPRISLLGQLK
jgi:hypothetical protein